MAERRRDQGVGTTRGDVRREFEQHTADERRDAARPPLPDPVAPRRWTVPIAWIVTLIIVALIVLGYIAVF